MPHFISLGSWTEQGLRNVKDSPKRVEAAKAAMAALGGKLVSFYYTVGKYDFIFVTEFSTTSLPLSFCCPSES